MNSLGYLGEDAALYEARRAHERGWRREHAAVARLLTEGPVLDCPVGTGRFAPLYTGLDVIGVDISPDMVAIARGRGIDAREGTAFDLPFEDRAFATVVCTRFFWWMDGDDFYRAFAELKRVSSSMIFSVRLGEPGRHKHRSLTHTRAHLLHALGDWRIEAEIRIQGGYRMIKAHEPN